MNKKKQRQKDLQKRLSVIIELYIDQKGKRNRKLLREYIEKKANEILLFSESLIRKKAKEKSTAEKNNGKIIHPSSALMESLQETTAKG